jgi:hypothetical protein
LGQEVQETKRGLCFFAVLIAGSFFPFHFTACFLYIILLLVAQHHVSNIRARVLHYSQQQILVICREKIVVTQP